jgi:sulfite reductase (NADPH) flavoprotein alpha-component
MPEAAVKPVYSKENPFPALVTESRLLSGLGSTKETRHFVVSLAGSGLTYEPGDSLAIYPKNRPKDVDELLAELGVSGDEPVLLPKAAETIPLREALTSKLALKGPTRRFVEALAARASKPTEALRLAGLLAPEVKDNLAKWLYEREFVDLLAEFPSARLSPQELVDSLRRLVPRLYSIASSQRVHPGEAYLIVAVVRYWTNGRDRVGACSTYLADRVIVGSTKMPVFVSNAGFRLPEDGSTDIIMVGPGTGIAPFRAFVEERAATGARGRNWLFFGDQRRATDFAYEEDWKKWTKEGFVTRFDTAFSRDQARKIYVQDRMRENAAELWAWLKSGARFYVCGDSTRMAKDVDAALHEIIAGQAGLTPEGAADYVKAMKKEKRYLRDVYS